MGARTVPAPEGYDVVKVGRRWIILITPRVGGRLVNFGFIADPDRGDGKRIPAEFARRAQALTYALIYQLETENARLRRSVGYGISDVPGIDELMTADV